jgi:hypothetical protein
MQYGCQKDFDVEYACGARTKTSHVSAKAGFGSGISMSCP